MPNSSKIFRAAVLCAGASLVQPLFAAQADVAKDYPNKPIRFIVPFVPGAGTDITGRTIAKKLSEIWGHQVVVDNRTGAAGAIGVEITAQALPDGYTICQVAQTRERRRTGAALTRRLPVANPTVRTFA